MQLVTGGVPHLPARPRGGEALGSFSTTSSVDATIPVLHLLGEVDYASAPTLEARLGCLVGIGHRHVAVELSGLDFMGAAGVRVLMDTATALNDLGGALTIRSAHGCVERLLEISGASKLISAGLVPIGPMIIENSDLRAATGPAATEVPGR